MLLFVDDCPERHIAFRKRNPFAMQTASVLVAKHELSQSGVVSELWLDHDLGEVLVSGGFFDPDTGNVVGSVDMTVMPLVDWMCRTAVVPRSLPLRIHSWNTPAARRMRDRFLAAGFVDVLLTPFSFA